MDSISKLTRLFGQYVLYVSRSIVLLYKMGNYFFLERLYWGSHQVSPYFLYYCCKQDMHLLLTHSVNNWSLLQDPGPWYSPAGPSPTWPRSSRARSVCSDFIRARALMRNLSNKKILAIKHWTQLLFLWTIVRPSVLNT